MTLSNRLKNLPPHFFSTLVRNVEAALSEGRDVINLGTGNPDQPTPPHIVKAFKKQSRIRRHMAISIRRDPRIETGRC